MYYLFGILWVVCCLLLAMFVTGKGLLGNAHYRLGLKILLAFYLSGLFLLFFAIVHS